MKSLEKDEAKKGDAVEKTKDAPKSPQKRYAALFSLPSSVHCLTLPSSCPL